MELFTHRFILESGVKEWLLDTELFEEEMSCTQMAKWQRYSDQEPWGRLPHRIAYAHFQDVCIRSKIESRKKGEPGIQVNYRDWMPEGRLPTESSSKSPSEPCGNKPDNRRDTSRLTADRWKYIKVQAKMYAGASEVNT